MNFRAGLSVPLIAFGNLLAGLLLIGTASSPAIELEPVKVIGTPIVDRHLGWDGHVNFIAWLDNQTVVFGGETGEIKCYGLDKQTEIWSTRTSGTLKQLATGRGVIFLLDGQGVRVLDGLTGKEIRNLDRGKMASTVKADYLSPNSMAWVPKLDAILVSMSSESHGVNSYLFDDEDFTLVGKLESDGFVTSLSPTPKGSHVVALSHSNNIRISSMDDKSEVFSILENSPSAIDAPFKSHALFDGDRTLIYSIDNSWSTGSVHVFDIKQKQELTKFNSRNGHLEMDIDFQNSRIALTGTEQNLTIVDFQGNVLAERKKAAKQRVVAVKFSPDGNYVAIGSWDNTARIFKVIAKPRTE